MDIVMSPAEIELYAEVLAKKTKLVEFGCGGSTLIAVRSKLIQIHTVDSSLEWLKEIQKQPEIADAKISGRLHLHWADIGEVKAWGIPVDDTARRRWLLYWSQVWRHADPAATDVVFIDGRFRISTAIYAALILPPDAVIVIHDFWSRPQYHVVLDFLQCMDRVDEIAVFTRKPDADRKLMLGCVINHALVWS
ncbi:MAG: hypothetical protein HQK56_11000 [Deltaproteobacteria bacterium]|nr:hypothetical protein [Deltaproteobacteria bacterium]